jgi:hypothetical protein
MSNETVFTVSTASGVPAGSYNATFEGVETYRENLDKFGEGIVLKFKITSGDRKGEEASRIVSKKFSIKTNLYKFAKALVGRDLVGGETFDFADHVGAKGMIVVEATDGGSTRVATFLRAAE